MAIDMNEFESMTASSGNVYQDILSFFERTNKAYTAEELRDQFPHVKANTIKQYLSKMKRDGVVVHKRPYYALKKV